MVRLLDRLGMSPICAFVLACYYIFFIIVQHNLPAGEIIIHSPVQHLYYLVAYALFAVLYAISYEMRQPIRLQDTSFWKGFGLMLLATAIYFSLTESFGGAKSLIPYWVPYYLDPTLQRLDILLHGGTAPSQWFLSLLNPQRGYMLNLFYLGSWSTVMLVYFAWQVSAQPSESRTQFLSCFVMLWIIGGIVAATLLSSVGPIFYSEFFHDQYSAMNAALVQRLYDPTLAKDALETRQFLLDLYHDKHVVDFNAMSAMPSLHTGVVMLIALHSYHYARPLAWLTIPYAFIIFIASFALGWHYAVDTYGSALLLAGIWQLNRWHIRRHGVKDRPITSRSLRVSVRG